MKKYHVTMYGNNYVLASLFIRAENPEDAVELAGYYVHDYLGYHLSYVDEIRIKWR